MNKRRKLVFDSMPSGIITPLMRVETLRQRIRQSLIKEYGALCMACRDPRNIEAHEVHRLFSGREARLEEVVLLCRKCHHVVHLERSLEVERDRLRALPGATIETIKAGMELYRTEMMAHYCKVNRVSLKRAEEDFRRSQELQPGWKTEGRFVRPSRAIMDYGPYADMYWEWERRRPEGRDEAEAFEMLPDHELPWDTAMWRDTFG
jgi:hypothetical protein